MEETSTPKMVAVDIPEWLAEAGKAAAQKQRMSFEAMAQLAIYEYAERYGFASLHPFQPVPQEQIPSVVQLGNALLQTAIETGASELCLSPFGSHVRVTALVNGQSEELILYPGHSIYDRFVVMAIRTPGILQQGTQKVGFSIATTNEKYEVFLSWDGDYNAEMVLKIVKVDEK